MPCYDQQEPAPASATMSIMTNKLCKGQSRLKMIAMLNTITSSYSKYLLLLLLVDCSFPHSHQLCTDIHVHYENTFTIRLHSQHCKPITYPINTFNVKLSHSEVPTKLHTYKRRHNSEILY